MHERPIVVTAAIIRKEGKVLLAQRKKDSRLEAGRWEFPGGKVEFMEDPADCIVREIKEELDMEIAIERLFTLKSHVYKQDGMNVHVILLAYLTDYKSGELKNLECQDSRWVDPSELTSFDLVEADKTIVKEFLGYHNY